MISIETLLKKAPYSLTSSEKAELYSTELTRLTRAHYNDCLDYKTILDSMQFDLANDHPAEALPFLPVRMFKDFDLKSIPDDAVHKTMTSSGTTGQSVSKIFLDKATASNQTKVLARIMSDLIGPKRLPMLVIDAKSTVKDRKSFSARGAGILGFSMFGRDVTFALDDNMELDIPTVEAFCAKYAGQDTFLFGFTSIIYQHFIQALQNSKLNINLQAATLLHGGGWKKLEDIAVDNECYKAQLLECAGIGKVHNYYGMVEQTGSIFTECSAGHLHCSIFSDLIIRDKNMLAAPVGETGLVQLVSLLPQSYPGHSILTEDIGVIIGEDDCVCGRKGKHFRILGRAKKAEVRGCSDTYGS